MLCLKALSSFGFKVCVLLCDGASSNLTVLKLLSGNPKTQFPVHADAETLRERYSVEASFINPEDPHGNPIFLMICPSHQVLELFNIPQFDIILVMVNAMSCQKGLQGIYFTSTLK